MILDYASTTMLMLMIIGEIHMKLSTHLMMRMGASAGIPSRKCTTPSYSGPASATMDLIVRLVIGALMPILQNNYETEESSP